MRQATNYSAAIKASVLAKALAPNAASIVELSQEFNIPCSTIYSWKTSMLTKQTVMQVNAPQRPNDKSAEAKFQAIIDTIGKTEQEQSEYCRANGIYSNHLDTWRKEMLENLGTVNTKKRKAEERQLMDENKKLKRELLRKDKALAEVSALLILKKKAEALWGGDEDV